MDAEKGSGERVAEALPFVFSEQEILEVRQGIGGKARPSLELMEKIQADPLAAECSVVMFFPVICERISQSVERPVVEVINAGTRSKVIRASFDDGAYIIKSLENSQEPAVAKLMAELGVGPEQFPSIDGYITEKFVEGQAVNQIEPAKCTPEYMAELGSLIGETVKKIHEQGILINDQLLSDDFGKSHTIIGPDGKISFVDFGASVDLNDFPNISDEAVGLIIRSDAFASFNLGMLSQQDLPAFVERYKQNLISQYKTKEEVIDRYDGQLINEGFSFLSQRVPNVSSLVGGFRKANG
jgi:tRNA A-37 threonylcarbamoyl transferase component Bud32